MGELQNLTEQEVKQSIRQFLLEIINETNIYLPKIKQIQRQLTNEEVMLNKNNLMYSMTTEKNYSYYALALSQNAEKRLNEMKELYHIENEIITKMLGLPSLVYSIYYKNADGNIVRIKTQNITDAAASPFGKNNLMLSNIDVSSAFQSELEKIEQQKDYLNALNAHYSVLETILQNTYKGKNYQSKVGKNVPEAFERDMVTFPHDDDPSTFSKHAWTVEEAWNYIKASSGNAPWYSGGDVLSKMFNVQVKGFTGKGSQYSKSGKLNPYYRITGLTSLRSLTDIANLLVNLLDTSKENIEIRVEEIYNLLNQDNWEHEVTLEYEKDRDKLIEKLAKQNISIPIGI